MGWMSVHGNLFYKMKKPTKGQLSSTAEKFAIEPLCVAGVRNCVAISLFNAKGTHRGVVLIDIADKGTISRIKELFDVLDCYGTNYSYSMLTWGQASSFVSDVELCTRVFPFGIKESILENCPRTGILEDVIASLEFCSGIYSFNFNDVEGQCLDLKTRR